MRFLCKVDAAWIAAATGGEGSEGRCIALHTVCCDEGIGREAGHLLVLVGKIAVRVSNQASGGCDGLRINFGAGNPVESGTLKG